MAINKKYVPIDNQPTIKPKTVTGIFTRYIAKTLPLAFDESMSYYECLCALRDYINTYIDNLNNVNDGLAELQEFYLQLQQYVNDYFDNLDVQEEINNKLDDMVEQGTLQEIIATYLNAKAVFGFDNIADMKDATNLINGSYAETLGYHSKNDGGGALYKIREITNDDVVDEMFIIELNDAQNQLIAELIYDNVNVKQLGAYGDGTHDDTLALQAGIDKAISKKCKLIIPGWKYKTTDTLEIDAHMGTFNIDAEDSYIDYTGTDSAILVTSIDNGTFNLGEVVAEKGTSIELYGKDGTHYIQYLNLYFKVLYAKDYCVYAHTNTGGWVTETRYYNGRLMHGTYGIYAVSNGPTISGGSILGHRLINIGIEGVDVGIHMKNYISDWSMYSLRTAETTKILEVEDTARYITMFITNIINASKLTLTDTSQVVIYSTMSYGVGDSVAEYAGCVFNNGVYMPISYWSKVKNLYNTANYDMTQLNPLEYYTAFQVGGYDTTIKLSKLYGYDLGGLNTLYVYDGSGGHTTTIQDSTGSQIYSGNIGYNKTLKLEFTGYQWLKEIISN